MNLIRFMQRDNDACNIKHLTVYDEQHHETTTDNSIINGATTKGNGLLSLR